MAEQKNTLVIEVDARNAENNIKKLAEELKKITEAGSKAAADSQKLGTTINQTNKITQVFNTTVNNSTKNINNNTKTVNNNTTAVERNSQVVDRNSRAVASQSSAFQQLASYMAGILTVGTAISKMDAYTNLQNRLKLVTTNQEELNKSLKDTFAIAQETAQEWGTVAQIYQRFADNAKKLNLTMDDTASITNTVSKAVAISGASAESANAALVQFGQAVGAGVLRGEELNSVLEQTPALAKAIANGLGLTIAEMRAVAAEGKITSDAIIKALQNSKESVDNLFAKTDFSIAMGFTQLNNAVIEFVGQAGHANGAAISLSAALKTLSENLGTVANVVVLGGIAYLTKAIAVQTVATYKSVDASIARRTATIAEAQASATASASELSRSAAIMNLTKWQLEDAKAQMLRLSGMQRQAYLQNVVMVAEAKHTAAIAAHKVALDADTLAQNANTAARSRGAMVMGALGGWTGLLTIGVTALAAGYMYLRHRTAEASEKLKEQQAIASKTKDELLALNGAQKEGAKNDLAEAYKANSKELESVGHRITNIIGEIHSMNTADAETARILREVRAGTMSYDEALAVLNVTKKNMPDTIKRLTGEINKYNELQPQVKANAEAQALLGVKVKDTGNKAQNAANGLNANTNALNANKTAANEATAAQQKFMDSLNQDTFLKKYENTLLSIKGITPELAKALTDFRKEMGRGPTNKEAQNILANVGANNKLESSLDAITEKEKERTKELKEQNKQLKEGNRLVGVSGNTGVSTNPHLDIRYTDINKEISKADLARFKAGGRSLNDYKISSGYGHRKPPKAGASSFHKGNDYGMAVGTPITTDYAVKSVETKKGSGGAGYMSIITFEDGVRISLLHQSADVMQKVKTGRSLGDVEAIAKQTNDIMFEQNKEAEELQKERDEMAVKLLYENMGRVLQIEDEKQRRIKEIEFASFKDDATKQAMLDDAKNRAEAEKQLFREKLSYEMHEFQATEKWKLDKSHEIKKLEITLNKELDSNARSVRLQSLEDEYKKNKEYLKLAASARESEYEQLYMNESQLIIQRYADEVREAMKVRDIDEQNHLVRMANARRELAIQNQINDARNGWRGVDPTESNPYSSVEVTELTERQASESLLNAEVFRLEEQKKAQMELMKLSNEEEINASIDFNDRMARVQQEGADRIADIEARTAKARSDLNQETMQGIMGTTTDMLKTMMGDQSMAYKVMFATEKAFSIARSLVAVKTAIALAAAQPFPLNLGAMATVAGLTASIVSDIMAVDAVGFKSGGYTGSMGTSDVAGVVHGQEFVLNAEATKRVGVGTLNAINNGAELQATRQANANANAGGSQTIDNNVKVVMVRDENEAKDMLYSSDAEKAFLYHMKRNRAKM